MRVAVIVVLISALATPSKASESCMTKTEALQRFGSYIYWHGVDHCWNATPARRYHQKRKVQQKIDQPKPANELAEGLGYCVLLARAGEAICSNPKNGEAERLDCLQKARKPYLGCLERYWAKNYKRKLARDR